MKKYKYIIGLLSLLLSVTSCGPSGSDESVSIKKLSTEDYIVENAPKNSLKKKNDIETLEAEDFYSLLNNDKKIFNLSVELNNPKKEEITAIEFACTDPNAKIELENSKGESEWFLLKDYPIANWGGTNRYQRTFSFKLSEEYLENCCSIEIIDIEVSGNWNNKDLDKNKIDLFLEKSDKPFAINTVNSDENTYHFSISKEDYVSDVTVEGASQNTDNVFSVSYETNINIKAKAQYGERIYEYTYSETITKTDVTVIESYAGALYTKDVQIREIEDTDNQYVYTAIFSLIGTLGTGFDIRKIKMSSEDVNYKLVSSTYSTNDVNNQTVHYIICDYVRDDCKEVVYVYANQKFEIDINGYKFDIFVKNGSFYKQNSENLYLTYNSMPMVQFEKTTTGEYAIYNFPLYPLEYFFGIEKGKNEYLDANTIESEISSISSSTSELRDPATDDFIKNIRGFTNSFQQGVEVVNILYNSDSKLLKIERAEANDLTYTYFSKSYLPIKFFVFDRTGSGKTLTMSFNSKSKQFEYLNYDFVDIYDYMVGDSYYDAFALPDIYGYSGLHFYGEYDNNNMAKFILDESYDKTSSYNLFVDPITLEASYSKA